MVLVAQVPRAQARGFLFLRNMNAENPPINNAGEQPLNIWLEIPNPPERKPAILESETIQEKNNKIIEDFDTETKAKEEQFKKNYR